MEKRIIQLHPERRECESVNGLYLAENLHAHARRPLVYADFISSLDGRIAIVRDGVEQLPESLTNANDLRLFMELLAQADCIITHGAYLRARAAGLLGDILHCGGELDNWRREHNLAPPAVVVCSASLDFPAPLDLDRDKVIIATGQAHDPARAERWRDQGYRLITAGTGAMVEAGALLDELAAQGLRSICFAAGPQLLESALKDRCLDLLYLTLSHQLIGGDTFHTLIPNAALDHCRLIQKHLIFDNSPTLKHPQWFAKFECQY